MLPYILGFGTSDDLRAAIIRGITGGWCSHAWIEQGGKVLHSEVKGGVHVDSLPDVLKRYPRHERFILPFDLDPGLRRVAPYVGRPWTANCTRLVCTVMRWSGANVPDLYAPGDLYLIACRGLVKI